MWHQFSDIINNRTLDLGRNTFTPRDSWWMLSTAMQGCVEHQAWKYCSFQKLSRNIRCDRSNMNSDVRRSSIIGSWLVYHKAQGSVRLVIGSKTHTLPTYISYGQASVCCIHCLITRELQQRCIKGDTRPPQPYIFSIGYESRRI